MQVVHFNQKQLAGRWDVSEDSLERRRSEGIGPKFLKLCGRVLYRPALEQVDSSSGAMGSAVNRAIAALVPIIAKAEVDPRVRQRWLERLREAVEDDGMSYIETLGDFWGELCVTPDLASAWADEFLPLVEHVWSPQTPGHGFFKGTTACMASMYAAGRHEQLLWARLGAAFSPGQSKCPRAKGPQ